ncbi:MAG: sulfatase-like hydrolase/transferase [Rikenellaceae bacterium]
MTKKLLHTLLAVATPVSALVAAETKPNILWIITDDHRADALACWNKATTGKAESALGYVSSPCVDKLAEEGVLFVNSFCNSPVSAPSRASMQTGKYPHHNGLPDFRLAHNQNDFANPLMVEVMREAGYKTTHFGKLGTRICNTPEKLSFGTIKIYDASVEMEGDLARKGITDWGKVPVYQKGQVPGEREDWHYPDGSTTSYYLNRKNAELTKEDLKTKAEFDKKHFIIRDKKGTQVLAGESPMPTEKTLDGRIAEEFMTYITNVDKSYKTLSGRNMEGAKPSQPQFINVGFHFPHTSVVPSKEFRDKFLNKNYNVPELTDEEWEKMPAQVRQWQKSSSLDHLNAKQRLQIIRDYYAFCAMGDKLIGDVVDKFKKYCADNKQEYLIVFACGDHGWHLGEQGVSCKASGYIKSNETAVVVVSSDKKTYPAGKVVTDFVEYVDFYPTFVSAVGFDAEDKRFDYLDGRDLALTATSKVVGRDYVLGETSVSGGPRAYLRSKNFAFSMKIRKDWRAPSDKVRPNQDIMWGLEAPREDVSMALFDLRVDKSEVNNVAYTKEYAELADWFRTKLGNIVLGDGRVEVNWPVKNDFEVSNFAKGSDDKKLEIPSKLIPEVNTSKKKKK